MLEFYPTHHHHFHTLIKDESNINLPRDKMKSSSRECADKEDTGIKSEKNYEICEGCGQKIHDRFLMRVADGSWHEHCLLCIVCGVNLNHSCYSRNTKLYCKADYDRIFSIKCSRCSERVHSQDMVMRVQHHIYHLPCFLCSVCCRPLEKGEQYFMRSGQLFCNLHYDTSFYSTPTSYGGGPGSVVDDLDDDLLDDGLCSIRTRDGRRGPKRPRTILTSAQRRQFKASFEVSPKPCRKVREALAKDTGLSVRVVQVWFQNQRAKMKKIQRKAKHSDGGEKGASDKDGKEDKAIKQESSGGDNYIGLDNSFGSSGPPINPNNPYSPDDYPANSNDSYCSSDVSLDGSSFEQIDEGTSDTFHNLAGEMQRNSSANNNGSYPSPNLLTLSSGIINPIDKLYLMQDSYFSGE